MAEELPPIPPGFTRAPPIPPGFTTEPPDPELAGWDKTPAEEGSLGIYKKAGAALLPSAGRAISGLWDAIKNYDQVYAHIKDVGISGLAKEVKDDVVKHYGSLDRAQKTFETDPFRVIMDVATLASGGGALVRTGARVASEALAPISRVTTGIPGAWGEMRNIAKAGTAGTPRAQAITGPFASARPPGMQGGGGQALWSGMTRGAATEAGAQLASMAGVPPWASRAAGAALQSPRTMAETQYGLGAARRIPATWRTTAGYASLGTTREALQDQAKELLKDKEQKKQLNTPELKIVRAAARGNADSRMMQAARSIIMQRGMPGRPEQKPAARIEEAFGEFGGPSGDVPTRQEGGPVEAGKVYGVGEAGPEQYVPAATGPAQSPGLSREPITGQEPAAQTHGGQTFFQFAWDKILEGGKKMIPDLMEAGKTAFMAPEEYDPSGPLGMAAGMTGARLPFAGAGELGAGGGRIITPQGLAVPGKGFEKAAGAASEAVGEMPKGAGPLDLTGKMRSDVPQQAIPRYEPPRGISPRLQDAMNNPAVVSGIRESMEAGVRMGADKWYHNDPIRRAWIGELGEKEGSREFARLMDYTAGTSPRSDVPTNIRNATYYYLMTGRELPAKLPYPYGHLAQALHRGNISQLEEAMRGGVGAERLPEYRGWDIFKNPKPVSFSEDLQGNLIPVAADTHAMRNLAMRTGDPRWLETTISEAVAKGKKPSEFQREWGEVKWNDKKGQYIVTYRPQRLVTSGRMSMREARDIPPFWAGKPNENEYAAVERFYSTIARGVRSGRKSLAPAEGQAAAWSGAGELTGLGTPPNLTFAEMFNNRIMYTALIRGEKPEDTLRYLIRKQKPLLGFGGAGLIGMQGLKENMHEAASDRQ